VPFPIKLDSVHLLIGDKTLDSPLDVFNDTAFPDWENPGFEWYYFKYVDIVSPGDYDNVIMTVVSENVTYTSKPFSITIPQKQ
jgi:hypothetical protein